MHTQYVIVEFHNCSPFLYLVKSNKPITIDKVVSYFVQTDDFNDEKDSITFVDGPTEILI